MSSQAVAKAQPKPGDKPKLAIDSSEKKLQLKSTKLLHEHHSDSAISSDSSSSCSTSAGSLSVSSSSSASASSLESSSALSSSSASTASETGCQETGLASLRGSACSSPDASYEDEENASHQDGVAQNEATSPPAPPPPAPVAQVWPGPVQLHVGLGTPPVPHFHPAAFYTAAPAYLAPAYAPAWQPALWPGAALYTVPSYLPTRACCCWVPCRDCHDCPLQTAGCHYPSPATQIMPAPLPQPPPPPPASTTTPTTTTTAPLPTYLTLDELQLHQGPMYATSSGYQQPLAPFYMPLTLATGMGRTHEQSSVCGPDRSLGSLLELLPIEAQPARTRQAYGMDKVWLEEFERLFSTLAPDSVLWNLVELESNPSIWDDPHTVLGYRGRYIVRPPGVSTPEVCQSTRSESETESSVDGELDEDEEVEKDASITVLTESPVVNDTGDAGDDDNGGDGSNHDDDKVDNDDMDKNDDNAPVCEEDNRTSVRDSSSRLDSKNNDNTQNEQEPQSDTQTGTSRRTSYPTRFRMFIDSAKVRFSCDSCGHGWTSMKGRVVFWYELFEVLDMGLVGYCAYKLFGQQCDVCKVEGRFERPMWYPEEVSKVLNNLYNKIGQVYFGFKMPAIDRQRRAGKPKTSHNSSLCQACHDGVCTDRK